MSRRRRRDRTIDPLANPAAVRALLGRLVERLPMDVPNNEREIVRMLRAASHCERRGWARSLRGRPSRYDRGKLSRLWATLGEELSRGTRATVSARTFTEHYLRLLSCPAAAVAALQDGRLNLFEALQLARITSKTTGMTSSGAAKLRARVLAAHVAGRGSARQLYERINELLGKPRTSQASAPDRSAYARPGDDEDDDLDAETDAYLSDPGAMFADQLRQVAIEMARIEPEQITEAESTALFDLLDQLYLRASKISRRTRE
ncbi:MAG TPA: hypothetical protein PLF26_16650 [Blastocatellia bacterium]|nr:hypothetical protein [Blastocatellia bacterium]